MTPKEFYRRVCNMSIMCDPGTAIILSSLALTGLGAEAIASAVNKPKAAPTPSILTTPPKAGSSDQLTAGQKVNDIYSSPQGVLQPAQSARQSLLGN